MKNTKLTRAELKEGYIQQYVIGNYRVTLDHDINDNTYLIRLFKRRFFGVFRGELDYTTLDNLTDARKEFARQVSIAKKMMKEGEK